MLAFLRQVFCDGNKASASRVMSMILVLFACGWVTYLVILNHALPPFDGLVFFIGTPYGLNVGSKAISSLAPTKQ